MLKRLLKPFSGLVLVMFFWTQPVFAQQPDEQWRELRNEIEALKKGQAMIQKELAEMKTLLRSIQEKGAEQPKTALVSVDGHPFKGEKTAKLTLIEFSDYQ